MKTKQDIQRPEIPDGTGVKNAAGTKQFSNVKTDLNNKKPHENMYKT